MKAPYYRLTARCPNDRCAVGEFQAERKRINYVSTSGRLETKTVLACPECRCWGAITRTEEVT
jgi:hypothetical protein